ncbi:hypothetical protein BBD29_02020 [Corynebacterium glutamicum]|nr:hypothetical protein AC079_02195 [Corynebacterium glutamicum]ANU35030.1 hypothetical protein BBD29_02020 [Corynebacterium glutamicum]
MKEKNMSKVFGIDLGTTYSAIAHITDSDTVEIIDNADGQSTTPSVVFFEDATNVVVGATAKQGAKFNPEQTVSLIKREMGRKGPEVERQFFGNTYTPESISAIILRELIENAMEEVDTDSKKAVITVPAYFGLNEKNSTKLAGEIAGIDVIDIVSEPVAAAIAEGFDFTREETVLVYDLGGGTFDCTIMTFSPDEGIQVKAVDGDRTLGGADWDKALYDFVLDQFREACASQLGDEYPEDDVAFVQELQNAAENAKISLTKKTKVRVPCAYAGASTLVEVTQEDFERATRHLLDRTLECVDRTLGLGNKNFPGLKVDKYLLVGGSSRMPQVADALTEKYGWTLQKTHFDHAVAKGAAMIGQGIVEVPAGDNGLPDKQEGPRELLLPGHGQAGTMTIQNLLSKAVGVKFSNEDGSQYIGHLIEQNTPLPAEGSVKASTLGDSVQSLPVHLFEQKGEVPSEELGANVEITPESGAIFTDLPNLPKGSPIHMTMKVDASGLLHFEGYEPSTDQYLRLEIEVSTMQREEVERAKEVVSSLTRNE